jgi:hypothetical protein
MPDGDNPKKRKQSPTKATQPSFYLGTAQVRDERMKNLIADAERLGLNRNSLLATIADRRLVPIDPSLPGAPELIAATAEHWKANPPAEGDLLAATTVVHADRVFRLEAYRFEVRVFRTGPSVGPVVEFRRALDPNAAAAHDLDRNAWVISALPALLDQYTDELEG